MLGLRLLQVIDLCFKCELTFALTEDRGCLTVLVAGERIEVTPTAPGSFLWDVSELLAALDFVAETQKEAEAA